MEKGQKFERRTYTKEFKLEAVRLVRSGIPKARVARDVGLIRFGPRNVRLPQWRPPKPRSRPVR